MTKALSRQAWSAADDALLRRLYPDNPTGVIASRLGRTVTAVYAAARVRGLTKSDAYLAGPEAGRLDGVRGANTRFRKGHTSWNKGTHFQAGGKSVQTQFKPGQYNGRAAQLVQPVGTRRVNADGYLDVKLNDEPGPQHRRWKCVHRLVWEQAHGPIPKGYAVVFRPGRRTTVEADITLDALELVTRAELMRRNSVHRHGPEIAQLSILRGALTREINRRTSAADTHPPKECKP